MVTDDISYFLNLFDIANEALWVEKTWFDLLNYQKIVIEIDIRIKKDKTIT